MTDTQPRPPDLSRRTLTPFGYAVAVVVPLLIAAVGLVVLHFNYDPEDVVTGNRVPLLTSDWRPGDPSEGQLISGTLLYGDDGCVHLQSDDGRDLAVVWPFDFEATQTAGSGLKLYDTDRKILARGGYEVRATGSYQDVGSYAGRPCAPPTGGQVAVVQSQVVVTSQGTQTPEPTPQG